MKKLLWTLGFATAMCTMASALTYTNTIYSEDTDGVLELGAGSGGAVVNGGETGSGTIWVGDWYSSVTFTGLSSVVIPFQLPDAGNVVDPFTSAELKLFVEQNQLFPGSAVDLYYVRTATTNDLLATDYYSGSAEGNGTRIVEDFFTSATASSNFVSTSDAALLNVLNTAYAGGAAAGEFVFLRLSYALDTWATPGDLCQISTRNNGNSANWPTLTLVDNVDDDSDLLPDTWEIFYFGDVAIGSIFYVGSSDPDNDDLASSSEFALGTNPSTNDTDGDLIIDGGNLAVEVNGVFGGEVNGFTLILNSEVGTTFFTDPLDSDSDDDGLNDGYEATTNATDNFYYSNPNAKDTDGDGVNDTTEVSCNSDPDNASIVPNDPSPIIGAEFFDYPSSSIFGKNGGEYFDIDNTTLNDAYLGHTCNMSDWYDTGFGTSADVAAQSLETSLGTLALRSFNGLNTGGQSVGVFSSDPATGSTTSNLYFKVKAVFEGSVTYAGVSFFNGGEERLFFGKPFGQDGFGLDNSDVGGSALIGATGIVDGVEYTIVGKIDIAATEISMWLNPNLAIDEVSNVPIVTSDPIIDLTYNAIRLASGGGGNVRWDDLVLSFTWDDLDYAGADIDGDTLRDTWELLYATNLSVLTTNVDFDADGLLNEEELDALSDPTKADTDGDGLSDFDEVNTGGVTTNGVTNIYVSLPYDTDGDDDGLSDFFEVTLGSNNLYITDPLDADTDDDGYDDAVEVAAGTDPTDPDDNPGGIIVNGKKDSLYGDPISVQLVQTGFGDNQSELNAAYAIVTNGTLCLMLTGNLEAKSPEGNTLEIFIDSTDAVTTNVLDAVGGDDDEANNMDGLTFDSDFTPDYHIWFFQDAGKGLSMWMSDLATSNTVTYTNLFGGPNEGSADTGTGAVNASPISVGFDNSNTAGVSGGSGAADTNAAIAVTTGLEMCIALSDIGNPTGTVKIAAMVDGENMNYLANQMLGSLTPPQGNLGGDGGGGFTGTLSDIDLTLFAGDQFFSVDIPGVVVVGPYGITSIQLISGGTQAEISLDGLTTGVGYIIQDSADLTGGFSDVGGSGFTATGPTETVTVPASGSEQFFQGATTP